MENKTVDLNKLLSQMTVKEKIGQLMQLNANFFANTDAKITGPASDIQHDTEVLANVGSTLNFSTAEEAIRIQKEHLERDRNKIPMLFCMDIIHGYRTIYPIPLALGASFDPELVAECTRMSAKESAAGCVNLTFAPMADYVRDARWGRVMESCGEDAFLNGIMGEVQVKALQGDDLSNFENIGACAKHIAAYGGAEAGRDYNSVELSEHILRQFYLPAYKKCLDAGSVMVMPSFNNLNGIPSTANPWLMKKVLREEWGYEGIVISDYAALKELCNHGVAADLYEAARMGFDCGCDIEMMSTAYCNNLEKLIEEGVFSEEQLDRSVMKILQLKKDLGLFDDPFRGTTAEKEWEVCLTPENRDIARRAAEECAVLLKNNGVLPFSKDVKRIALIGPYADNRSIRGPWSAHGKDQDTVSVKEGIEKLLPNAEIVVAKGCSAELHDTVTDGFAEAVEAARNADAVIICVGEPAAYSGEGNSRADIELPGMQDDLIISVCEANPNAAVVVFNGRPLALTKFNDHPAAILEMFFPGTEGGTAVADLLFGEANPCGKLTMSMPKTSGQCPIYYNRTNTGRPKRIQGDAHQKYSSSYVDVDILPLYFFGEGLSYSKFEYESMTLDKKEMKRDESITVSVTLKNVSDRKGKETVQLYMRDMVSSTVRPIQELIAFEKIELDGGESRTVTFEIREDMLRLWNPCNEYVSEAGEFTLMVGYADHFVLTDSFRLVD